MFESIEVVNQAKERFNKWSKKGFPTIDKELLEILPALNKIQEVAPYYSCASHPEERDYRFYLLFILTKEGYDNLTSKVFTPLQRELAKALIANPGGDNLVHQLGISNQMLLNSCFETPTSPGLHTTIIDCHLGDQEEKNELFTALLKVIKDIG